MTKLRIRPLAREDLKKIWRYSYQKWGRRQADSYLNDVGRGINALSHSPDKGKNIDAVKENYRLLRVREHCVVYFLSETDTIDIVRVLGKRMDIDRHI